MKARQPQDFFLLLGQQGNKAVLDWVMKEGLIPSDMSVRSVRRICVWLNERVRLMDLNGVVEYSRRESPLCLPELIREWILPGTTIIPDCWRAYECLSDEGYRHLTVNHSLTFKDPETGAHTNAIEGTWSAIKRNLKGHTAHVEGQFDSYLAEYMWRRSNEHKMIDANFKDYLKAIARVYPPHESDDQKK
ncbi:DDE_Tnp_IS1595 domain-containing protein [Trichonephila clavipes]|nr:DDE_Tnp_IS1595 domain-containing protein [Trichonephila clavipes]